MSTNIRTLGVFSPGLYKNKSVKLYFNNYNIVLKPKNKVDIVVGWGRKKNTNLARDYSKRTETPYLSLEDGFIHSMSQGRLGAASWSLIVDNQGIFYDANSPSSLEEYINNITLNTELCKKALNSIKTIKKYGVTKYNNSKMVVPEFITSLNNPILVIDQVDGDMSIPYSLASKQSFDKMLSTAIEENPNSDIVLKIHPDVIKGKKKGCTSIDKNLPSNVHILSDNINPIRLLEHVQKVYVVSSQMGFEALLMEKDVICFGAPFYAGWGLTDDRINKNSNVLQRRKKRPTLLSIFYAAYYQYSHYFHPDTMDSCQLDDILEYVALQQKNNEKNKGKLFCIGFTPWKKRFIYSYLKTPDNEVLFSKTSAQAIKLGFDNKSTSCLWSSRSEEEAIELTKKFNTPIWRIEDGFIRSVSLGSNYAPPASLIIDKTGLYFDPNQESDLETVLSNKNFNEQDIKQATKIKEQLINHAISKYNVGKRDLTDLFSEAQSKTKILIPGQVNDDASILKGCKDINSNLSLLKKVKEKNPGAYIIYKPHPDVISGNRLGHLTANDYTRYCDKVITDVSITDCLSQVDEVHTMTSLVGFEGLIRGLSVHCYGTPFYSGWGLTTDRHICERRTRKLTINELVAGTLIEYPVYMNWEVQHFTTPDFVTQEIYRKLEHLKQLGKVNNVIPVKHWRTVGRMISLIKTLLNPKLK